MSVFKRIQQEAIEDTANSSVATINAGDTWNSAGSGTSTLGVNSIQVIYTPNQ